MKHKKSELTNNHYIKELDMAKRVQQGLLSVANPDISGITIAKRCVPAQSIGGDFYTFIKRDTQELSQKQKIPGVIEYIDTIETYLGIVIGDVAGHGVSSALVMALASGLFSEIAKNTKSPGQTLKSANDDLHHYIENSLISHVTAFYAVLNLRTKQLTYSKAGHPPALLLHKNSEIDELSCDGLFLGMFEHENYEEKIIQLESGDRLILYTDGLTEAANSDGDVFGLNRLKDEIKTLRQTNPEKTIDTLLSKINNYSGSAEIKDDQTIVVIDIS
ncbi:PP2C family protein-serine/threonine phosphatase [Thermoproteota archaeon]